MFKKLYAIVNPSFKKRAIKAKIFSNLCFTLFQFISRKSVNFNLQNLLLFYSLKLMIINVILFKGDTINHTKLTHFWTFLKR